MKIVLQVMWLILLSAALARADETAPRPVLEEVLVTAQKREQRLIDVPFSMNSFSEGLLTSTNLRDLSQLMTVVPGASEGLSISAGQKQFQLRGISGNNVADPTIGYYIDDAAFFVYGQAYAPVGRAFDMQRVEVLRGPQSTLYGNGSMGGAVRFIPEPANLEDVQASVRAGWSDTQGGDSGYYVDGALSIPLIDNALGLRVVAGAEKLGGYHIDVDGNRDTNEARLDNLRGSLRWQATDALELKLLYVSDHSDQDGSASLSSLDPPIAVARSGDFNDRAFDILAATLIWELPGAVLTSTTTGIDHETQSLFNGPLPIAPDGVLQARFDTEGEALNNETRLVSRGDGNTQWLMGFFYSDTESSDLSLTNIPDIIPESIQTKKSRALSLFGEISHAFANGKIVPLLGLRYFEDERQTSISGTSSQPEEETFDSVNPRFNLAFNPNLWSNYYVNVAKGFRSGNFNNPDICALHRIPVEAGGAGLPCEDSVDSDQVWSYELGTKLTLGGGQFSLEAAAFFQDWEDVRQVVQVAGLFQDYQVGNADIFGVDVDLIWTPGSLPGFSLRAGANWNQAEFVDLDEDIARASGMQEGDRLPLVPEWTLSLMANYDWSLAGPWLGQANIGYSYIDRQYGQFGTLEAGDPRGLLRTRLGVDNESIGFWFFGSNLLGEDGAIYLQNPSSGLSFFTQDYPRQLGVEVTYRY